MTNTSGRTHVGPGETAIAPSLSREILAQETAAQLGQRMSRMTVERRTTRAVGAALNGEPVPPSTSRAQHVRRECQRSDGYAGWEGIAALDLADIADGVPAEVVIGTHEAYIAALRAHAPAPNLDRPLDAYQVPEMKYEHALNVVQRVLDRNPDSAEAHEAVARQGRAYLRAIKDLIGYCDRRAVVLRGIPCVVHGPRMGERMRRHAHH